mmetsp:Transcript_19528/g.41070  ORF Transcript_19528/g.41070 Transcript_19528/m.41070 type:complete len:212 (-) Transcript_19528:1291-1926(-)
MYVCVCVCVYACVYAFACAPHLGLCVLFCDFSCLCLFRNRFRSSLFDVQEVVHDARGVVVRVLAAVLVLVLAVVLVVAKQLFHVDLAHLAGIVGGPGAHKVVKGQIVFDLGVCQPGEIVIVLVVAIVVVVVVGTRGVRPVGKHQVTGVHDWHWHWHWRCCGCGCGCCRRTFLILLFIFLSLSIPVLALGEERQLDQELPRRCFVAGNVIGT